MSPGKYYNKYAVPKLTVRAFYNLCKLGDYNDCEAFESGSPSLSNSPELCSNGHGQLVVEKVWLSEGVSIFLVNT